MEAAALESGLSSGSSAVLGSAAPCSCRPSSLLLTFCAGVVLRHQRHSAQLTQSKATVILSSYGGTCQTPRFAASQELFRRRTQPQTGGVTGVEGVRRGAHPEDDAGALALWAAGLLLADSTASSGEGVSNLKPPTRCCAPCRAMGKVSLSDADCCGCLTAHHAVLQSDHACLQRCISRQPCQWHRHTITTSEVSSMLVPNGLEGWDT